MIVDAVRQLGPWSWWILGLLLLGVEVLAPGAFFLWFGIAALIVGALALMVVVSWQAQAILFVALALLLVILGRRFYSSARRPGDQPHLNQRAARLVGGVYPLAEAISNGHGRIRIDDTTWSVTGPDLPAGTRVRVTGFDGSVLKVVAT
ncbi:NfeD family protein [Kaistia defluvii]|uniref:NfeD family protein n=1 Tax=Kaistia defluvii TaxID=410841 RepID=UPI0022578761|nr:NfeD family protein [Kaistia defluvii]MCX5520715.1 NfeD family protein [Kaistia defluvii]